MKLSVVTELNGIFTVEEEEKSWSLISFSSLSLWCWNECAQNLTWIYLFEYFSTKTVREESFWLFFFFSFLKLPPENSLKHKLTSYIWQLYLQSCNSFRDFRDRDVMTSTCYNMSAWRDVTWRPWTRPESFLLWDVWNRPVMLVVAIKTAQTCRTLNFSW